MQMPIEQKFTPIFGQCLDCSCSHAFPFGAAFFPPGKAENWISYSNNVAMSWSCQEKGDWENWKELSCLCFSVDEFSLVIPVLCFALKGVSLFPLPCLPCNYLSTGKDTVVENLTIKFRERESGPEQQWLRFCEAWPVTSACCPCSLTRLHLTPGDLRRFAPWVLKRGLSLMWPLHLIRREQGPLGLSTYLVSSWW